MWRSYIESFESKLPLCLLFSSYKVIRTWWFYLIGCNVVIKQIIRWRWWSIDQSINWSINWSINQSINQSAMNQLIDRSINQWSSSFTILSRCRCIRMMQASRWCMFLNVVAIRFLSLKSVAKLYPNVYASGQWIITYRSRVSLKSIAQVYR